MPKIIEDEFSDLPISNKEKYLLRKKQKHLCRVCSEPAVLGTRHCMACLIKAREAQRKRDHAKGRYEAAKSYWLERQMFVRQILSEPGTGDDPGKLQSGYWDADIFTRRGTARRQKEEMKAI